MGKGCLWGQAQVNTGIAMVSSNWISRSAHCTRRKSVESHGVLLPEAAHDSDSSSTDSIQDKRSSSAAAASKKKASSSENGADNERQQAAAELFLAQHGGNDETASPAALSSANGLVLLALEANHLEPLKWEPARGTLFPHLYRNIRLVDVLYRLDPETAHGLAIRALQSGQY